MNTECNAEQLEFHGLGKRQIIGKFDGGRISSDGGGLLLRETEQRTHILKRLAACFIDYRKPELIEHSVESLIKQRVMAVALGYEDLNDHDALREADQDAAAGAVEELARIVSQIRARWPEVRIIVRGDSGFCREPIVAWCEAHGIDYVLGVAKNDR